MLIPLKNLAQIYKHIPLGPLFRKDAIFMVNNMSFFISAKMHLFLVTKQIKSRSAEAISLSALFVN